MARRQGKYYRIGEASRITGLEPHVLRYWEKEFSREIRPHRIGRQRLYREADLKVIKRIKTLLYDEGLTIAGAKRKLRNKGEYISFKKKDCKSILLQIKQELQEILEILDRSK